jgi:hypothetical protein
MALCKAEVMFLFPVFLYKVCIYNFQKLVNSEKQLVYTTRKFVSFLVLNCSDIYVGRNRNNIYYYPVM